MEQQFVLIVSKEFLDRINAGLGEIQGKFSIPVVFSLQQQIEEQTKDPAATLKKVGEVLVPSKAAE